MRLLRLYWRVHIGVLVAWWWFRESFSGDCLRIGRHFALWPWFYRDGWIFACTCGKVGSTRFGWTGETSK
jgi:hypothetical protein